MNQVYLIKELNKLKEAFIDSKLSPSLYSSMKASLIKTYLSETFGVKNTPLNSVTCKQSIKDGCFATPPSVEK